MADTFTCPICLETREWEGNVSGLFLAESEWPNHMVCKGCEPEAEKRNQKYFALHAAAGDLRDACEALLDLAVWASGAPVFNPGGDAREGWLKVCGAIDKGYAALAKARGEGE